MQIGGTNVISLIAVIGKNLEIGKNGDLAFRGGGELRYFRDVTRGHKIFMGIKTYHSIPQRLPDRDYYVASTQNWDAPEWVNKVQDAEKFLRVCSADDELFVIGGGAIYTLALPYADKLYLTEADGGCTNADTFFPKFDKKDWSRQLVGEGQYDDGLKFRRFVYTRK